jgi:hypothetical protein
MQLQRLNTVKEGREDTLQLWALVPGAPPPLPGRALQRRQDAPAASE